MNEVELTRRLAQWANAWRLSELDAATIRARVLASEASVAESAFDADWLWSLLRPVTDLAEIRVPGVIEQWFGTPDNYKPYLQLA